MAAYADELRQFPPDAVSNGCEEWARTQSRWPALSELLAVVRGYVPKARSLANPDRPEDFLTRCKRVGGHDAVWQRAHHYLLEAALQAHLAGYLTDEHLAVCIAEADSWREPPRMPRPRQERDLGAEVLEAVAEIKAGGGLRYEFPSLESERQAMAERAAAESRFSPSEEDVRASVQRLRI